MRTDTACRAAVAVVCAAVVAWGCGGPGPSKLVEPSPVQQEQPAPPPGPPPAPTHSLTMTASPSCTAMPAAAKTRTYPVAVEEKPGGSLVVLAVPEQDIMVGWANEAGFTGTRAGNTVRFELTDDIQGDYAMIERIPGVGDMGFVGTATGTIDRGRIVAVFSGRYDLDYGSGPVLCEASNHRMEFTPTAR